MLSIFLLCPRSLPLSVPATPLLEEDNHSRSRNYFSSSKAVMAALPEHCVLYRQVRGVPIAPWCVSLLPLFFLPPFLLPSWPATLVLTPAAQPSPSINLHMCWREGGGYRQQ